MPRAGRLVDVEIEFSGPYYPSAPQLAPRELQGTIKAGSNVWRRPGGEIEVANGLLQTSATNVGPRIFAADIQRATIEGAMVGNRLPYAGLLRYENAALFFVSEETSKQVYLNEAAATGVTTSSTAGRLRVAIPDGVGGYSTFDAGFEKPLLVTGDVISISGSGLKNMTGSIGVAIAPWRTTTNAIGPPSDLFYRSLTAASQSLVRVDLPLAVSGQDGWILGGTRWNDQSGQILEVRRVYITPRGTFTATNGSAVLTAGVNTHFTLDLQRADLVVIDGNIHSILSIQSDSQATLTAVFTGTTGAGKTMTITDAAGDWFDGELEAILLRNIIKPPRCAGVLQYAGRVFVWGCLGQNATATATGPMVFAAMDSNPEHCGIFGIRAASGSDLVNVLGGDGPMYLMTTTDLEVVSFTGNPDTPFIVRTIAEPGFKAATNGVLYSDYFYGFNRRPLRTRAEDNIDVQFAAPVWSDMEGWDAERVMVAVDPVNQAVLYIYDNLTTSIAMPWMTQQNQWGPPLNFSARILDTAVVNGELYVTYLDGANVRVNQWEGGAGIGGTRYIASQYLDPSNLLTDRVKGVLATGKVASVSIYAVEAGAAVPDVSVLGQAAVTFTETDTDVSEPAEFTNVAGRAFAYRVDFGDGGHLDKLVSYGTPRSERR